MSLYLRLRIVLENPPPGVDFGLQKGRGNDYETIQTHRSNTGHLRFEFTVRVKKGSKDPTPNFLGPFVQGPTGARFVYIDIGTFAGQTGTNWSRRLKIPFSGITWDMIQRASSDSNGPAASEGDTESLFLDGESVLETRVRGTGKDGTPTCGTVKPFAGWKLISVS